MCWVTIVTYNLSLIPVSSVFINFVKMLLMLIKRTFNCDLFYHFLFLYLVHVSSKYMHSNKKTLLKSAEYLNVGQMCNDINI